MSDALHGARVQRIDAPRPELFVLTLHGPDAHGCLVLSTAARSAPVGWVRERPRGAPASAFVRLLRKHLLNGRILSVRGGRGAGTTDVTIRRGTTVAVLRIHTSPPNLVLALDGVVAAALHPSRLADHMLGIGAPLEETHAPPVDIAQLETEGARIVESAESAARSDRAHALERVVARRRAQLVRRLRAIDGDLARVDEVAPMRERAALLLAHLREIPRDATEAVVMDWSSDPPRPIRIAIDPARGARGEADALFRRARKLERGGEIALERHAETERDIAALDAIARAIPNANEEELARLERDAARLGARAQRPGAAAEAAARRPYRIFSGSRGRTILVGRSAEDNDTLTLRVARPQDHWLHARGVTGAHVVVQLQRGETCPADLLIDAAHLAAYFSDARGEATIEVQHTSRRHVRKPRGSPPGGVVVSREKVIVLRVEPERLQRLLRSEQQA